MRRSVWSLCIWGSISIFTQTDIFSPIGIDENEQNSQLQQIVNSYVAQVAELGEDL